MLTDCPLRLIGPATWRTMEYAEHLEHGLPPVVGGALDQAAAFLAAAKFLRAEGDRHEAETIAKAAERQ